MNSVSWSDVLDRFQEGKKVGLTVESQYDPTKVERAVVVLRELLAEHGHQFAVVKVDVKTIPPASVSINLNVKEGSRRSKWVRSSSPATQIIRRATFAAR